MKPTIGRIVHFVLPAGHRFEDDRGSIPAGGVPHFGVGAHRPAIVTHVWPSDGSPHSGTVQLQVFTEALNDGAVSRDANGAVEAVHNVMWFTSVAQDETEKRPGTWHWPERED